MTTTMSTPPYAGIPDEADRKRRKLRHRYLPPILWMVACLSLLGLCFVCPQEWSRVFIVVGGFCCAACGVSAKRPWGVGFEAWWDEARFHECLAKVIAMNDDERAAFMRTVHPAFREALQDHLEQHDPRRTGGGHA